MTRISALVGTAAMLLAVGGVSPTLADEPVRLTVQVGTQSGDVLNLVCSTAKGDRITDTRTVP